MATVRAGLIGCWGRGSAGVVRPLPGLRPVALAAALLLGACALAVALALPGAWWLTWVALVPLFVSIRVLPPRRAMLGGAIWGLWVYIFSVMTVDTAVSPTPLSLGLLVGIPSVYAYIATRLTRRIGFVPLLLAYGWIGVEFALTPLGLKSGLLGSAHGGGLVADFVGQALGCVFLGFLLAGATASVLAVLTNVRFSVLRQGFLAFIPDFAGDRPPRATLCGSVVPLREAYPRGPPLSLAHAS